MTANVAKSRFDCGINCRVSKWGIQNKIDSSVKVSLVRGNFDTVVAYNRGSQNRGNLQNRGQNLNDQSDH